MYNSKLLKQGLNVQPALNAQSLAYHAPEGLEPDEEPKYFLRFEKSGDSIVLVGMFSFFIVMKSLLQNAFFWPRLLSWQRQNWREGRALEF